MDYNNGDNILALAIVKRAGLKVVKYLYFKGVSIHHVNDYGNGLLVNRFNQLGVMKWLIEKGIEVDSVNL